MAKQENNVRKPALSGEQRRRRRNQIIMAVFSILIISIWIITMVARF